jgi:hypothetical protein
MTTAPGLKELERCVKREYRYDFEQAARILQAMDGLRHEAVRTRIPEIVTMVESSFEVLRTTYHCILRNEKLPTVPPPDRGAAAGSGYDFGKAERILSALNHLRSDAVGADLTEIVNMIDATFRLILTSYYCVLRLEMTGLPGTDDGGRH